MTGRLGYFACAAALLALLVATVAAARVDLGPLSTTVALAIAGVKAALVILYFMHVRRGPRLIWLYAAGGFLWLALLITLVWADVTTRAPNL